MSAAKFIPDPAARRLEGAWLSGQMLDHLPQDERPNSIDEGYLVQAAMLNGIGEKIAGWKIAGASPRGLRGELPHPPAIGALVSSRLFHTGTTLTTVGGALTLEAEIAFSFSRTVSPAHEPFDPATMIARTFAAIEIVRSRFVNRKAVGQPSFIADNVGFHALICGESVAMGSAPRFADDAEILLNGTTIARSLVGDDRTRPYESLAFLWQRFAQGGKTIPQSAIITTGTLSVPVDVAGAGHVVARIGHACVEVMLADDNAT